MDELLLTMEGITKAFPGVTALDNVTFTVNKGELHGLVGENGAGKSTLMNILGGLVTPDSGCIKLADQEVRMPSAAAASALGIGFVHQESNLLGNLTVLENVFLSNEHLTRIRSLHRASMAQAIEALNQRLGYTLDPYARVSSLNLAQQQCVEIARALMQNPRLLILDEPTAALDEKEVERLYRILDMLKAQGVSIIYISHRLDEVVHLADRVTVLKDGKIVGTLNRQEITNDRLITMMVGRVLEDIYPDRSDLTFGKEALTVQNLNVGQLVRGVNFSIKAGEIVGLGGLEGQGQREVLRAIFGDVPIISGQVLVDGLNITKMRMKKRIQKGVAYVTHDRRGEGLVLSLSLGRNSSLASLCRFRTRLGFIRYKREREAVAQNIERMQIKATSDAQMVGNLSGGNQQKVMLSRWLMTLPRVLMIDEPTKGVDVGARMSVYRIIDALTREGIAIVMLTSDMMELMGLSDRVLVFYDGKIQRELPRSEVTEERIMRAASGLEETP